MTDDEKYRHIAQLEKEVGALKVQMSALYTLFLEVDPSDPEAGTKAKRIMEVVKAVERGSWAFKIAVRFFLFLGAAAGVFAAWKGLIFR